jgi:hypothetical protein
MIHRNLAALGLAAGMALAVPTAQAQFAIEDDQGVGVTGAADFSYRYYLEQMQRFPDRLGMICVAAYELDKTGLHDQSFMFFSECARRGNPASMIYLSLMYELGLGTALDLEASTAWLKRSAEAGYSLGQYHYAMALLAGKGTPRDPAVAQLWLGRAAAQGDRDAAAALAKLASVND